MLTAYLGSEHGLLPLASTDDLAKAAWIDLDSPDDDEIARLAALGITIPSLEDMEAIEVSNRLYNNEGVAYMVIVVPFSQGGPHTLTVPVAFILSPQRLVTVRHHNLRAFETFPTRAGHSSCGAGTPARIFAGLLEEIVGRLADSLEAVGRVMDQISADVLGQKGADATLLNALVTVSINAERNGRTRLCLMTLERMMAYHASLTGTNSNSDLPESTLEALRSDIHALEVHSDFMAARINLVQDATMGMINLQQNRASKTLSVVATLFLPPTLIASVYGMNFHSMAGLQASWGYPAALAGMLVSSVAIYLLFRWRNWL